MADIGIIGGADGPTVIFVASRFSGLLFGIGVGIAAAIILAVVFYKKSKKK